MEYAHVISDRYTSKLQKALTDWLKENSKHIDIIARTQSGGDEITTVIIWYTLKPGQQPLPVG